MTMKNILALILFLPFFTFAQQPAAVDPILVQDLDFTLVRPEVGKPYKVLLRKNHALLAEGIPDSTWVTICYGCGLPQPVNKDTLDSENFTYENWTRNGQTNTPGWYKGTISWSSTGEAKYTCEQCTGFELYGETGPNHGTGTVTVGSDTKTVDWKSATTVLPAKVVGFKGLAKGNHTITIKPVSGNILIDYLVVYR